METEPSSRVILGNLYASSGSGASLAQIRMWVIPQKAEHESDYNINRSYFEMLIKETVRELMDAGYVKSSLPGGVDDGDAQIFSLTEKGKKRVEELTAQAEQAAAADY
ncbi:MAG: hypothetical protein ABI347_03500 [Nitrososphaera sp.]|jgi:hypothetical protein